MFEVSIKNRVFLFNFMEARYSRPFGALMCPHTPVETQA
jgi:hypothetical protein